MTTVNNEHKRKDVSAAVGLLYTDLQVMGPGESMTAHRHIAFWREEAYPDNDGRQPV